MLNITKLTLCFIVITYIGTKLCGRKEYNPGSHVCCCGRIYRKDAGNECCGMFYYSLRSQKCCDQTAGILVSTTGESCPLQTMAAKWAHYVSTQRLLSFNFWYNLKSYRLDTWATFMLSYNWRGISFKGFAVPMLCSHLKCLRIWINIPITSTQLLCFCWDFWII